MRYSIAAQLERTVLAWNRTALAIAANGALVVREGIERNLTPVTIIGFVVIAIGALVWVASSRRYTAALDRRASHLITDRQGLAFATASFAAMLSIVDLLLATT